MQAISPIKLLICNANELPSVQKAPIVQFAYIVTLLSPKITTKRQSAEIV